MANQRVEIDVSPQFAQGEWIICDVDSPSGHFQRGHIRLRNGHSYAIEFRLQPGKMADLHFKPDENGKCDAFWSHQDSCPKSAMNAPEYSSAKLDGPKKLQVDVDLNDGRDPSAIHYRLNFDNGRSFDPIIIHE